MCGFACPLRAHPTSLSFAMLTPAAQLDGGIWEGDLQGHCLACSWIIHYIRLIKNEEPAATIRYASAPPAQTILELLINTEIYQGGDASALWLHLFWAAVLSQWELTWVSLSHQFRRSTAEQLTFYHLEKLNFKVTFYFVPFPRQRCCQCKLREGETELCHVKSGTLTDVYRKPSLFIAR